MSMLTAQLVWLLLSYLGTKLASKTWGRALLAIGRGYLAARSADRAEAQAVRIERTRPLTAEERATLSDADRRTVDHDAA